MEKMNVIMHLIDSDTAWFIVALLVILLILAVAGIVGCRIELRNARRRQQLREAKRHEEFLARLYRDMDTPTFMREAKHPLDSMPYDIRRPN